MKVKNIHRFVVVILFCFKSLFIGENKCILRTSAPRLIFKMGNATYCHLINPQSGESRARFFFLSFTYTCAREEPSSDVSQSKDFSDLSHTRLFVYLYNYMRVEIWLFQTHGSLCVINFGLPWQSPVVFCSPKNNDQILIFFFFLYFLFAFNFIDLLFSFSFFSCEWTRQTILSWR